MLPVISMGNGTPLCRVPFSLISVSFGGELDIFQRRLRHATGVEKAADISDIGADHSRLYIEEKGFRIIE